MDANANVADVPSIHLLDQGSLHRVLACLAPRQVAASARICKAFRDVSDGDALWKLFYEQELRNIPRPLAWQPLLPDAAFGGPWKPVVKSGLALRDLRVATWHEIPNGARVRGLDGRMVPTAREGHAAASWGNDSVILFGGWGCGIRNDLFLLERVGQDGFRWRALYPSGDPPAIRYGHSVTRCGAAGELLVVYGGMQAGGYMGEIEELAVLRPRRAAGLPQQCPTPAATTSTAAGSEDCKARGTRVTGRPASEVQYEWWHPDLKGAAPKARGYHAACASPDGLRVYIFGGIADEESCNTLAVIDVQTWTVEVPVTHGAPPRPRFGCSMAVWGGGLWVVGGGYGSDLARSGEDLQDIHRLDLGTMTWSRSAMVNRPPTPQVLGRCHAYCMVGSKLVMFGGSLDLGNQITWLDLERRAWGQPSVYGAPPPARMSAVMAPSGSDLLVFGGWIYSHGEMGDLYRLKLDPPESERALVRQAAAFPCAPPPAPQMAPRRMPLYRFYGLGEGTRGVSGGDGSSDGASGSSPAGGSDSAWDATAAAARVVAGVVPTDEEDAKGFLRRGQLRQCRGASDDDGTGRAPSAPGTSQLQEALTLHTGQYFSLIRQAQALQAEGSPIPAQLLRRMHQATLTVRLLYAQAKQQLDEDWVQSLDLAVTVSSSEEERSEEGEGRASSSDGDGRTANSGSGETASSGSGETGTSGSAGKRAGSGEASADDQMDTASSGREDSE